MVWPEEWATLMQLYGGVEGAEISATVSPEGLASTTPDVCPDGCVAAVAQFDYEDQFKYQR